jgi:hypothetical protein
MNKQHAWRISFSVATALIAAASMIGSAAASHGRAASAKAAPDSAFTSEKGRFRILVGGQQVGKEDFEISLSGANWTAHGSSEIQTPQGTEHVTGTLAFRADGTPVRYEWSTAGAKKAAAAVAFDGTVATVELRLENARPFTQRFTFESPHVAVLDNNLYHQYAILAHLYDWSKKGAQTFSVLVPQEMTPGIVTVESLGRSDGKLEELRVKTDDLELDLFLDNMKLVRILAPASNAEILRD